MRSIKNAFVLPSGWLITASQELSAFACKMLLKTWGDGWTAKIELPKLYRSQRYVIVGNHQSQLDPFVIFALMPFSVRRRLLPLKFMTIPKVYHKWFIKPFAYALGCFPAHIREYHHHTYGVSGSVKLLNRGYNICMFPEGRRVLRSESGPKPGISQILADYPDAKLILAHLEWYVNANGKRRVALTVAPAPDNLNKNSPTDIMNAIYAL